MIKCALCKFAAPFVDKPADFIINGQGVCEDHVDAVGTEPFGKLLRYVQGGAR